MTDRTHSDRVTRKWELIARIDESRAMCHLSFIETWRYWRNRNSAQQDEIEVVLALALHQLAECDRMEASIKSQQ